VRVAPFKAQNMSLNSAVTADGAEIGRAQAVQAAARRVAPEAAMNPVLLKPGSDQTSQVVVLGRPWADVSAMSYRQHKAALLEISLQCLADLRSRYDVVVCEGAGSPPRSTCGRPTSPTWAWPGRRSCRCSSSATSTPAGVFAALFGTLALLSPEDQALVCGFVVNKFRGDVALLEPGLAMLERLTGRPTYGVLPWTDGLELDVEDSLGLTPPWRRCRRSAVTSCGCRSCGLPRLSNWTDVDALRSEPGAARALRDDARRSSPTPTSSCCPARAPRSPTWPGCAARARRVLAARAAEGRPVLGICGGYQMLGTSIDDDVESRAGTVDGLGCCPVRTAFGAEKVLGRPTGAYGPHPVTTAYEIHHGVIAVDGGEPLFAPGEGLPGRRGARHGVARRAGVRRRAAGAAGRGGGRGRTRLAAGDGGFRGRPAGAARRARRSRRRPPRHRGRPRAACGRRSRRPALRPARRPLTRSEIGCGEAGRPFAGRAPQPITRSVRRSAVARGLGLSRLRRRPP
jgi:adenosylcobyric acid synthase